MRKTYYVLVIYILIADTCSMARYKLKDTNKDRNKGHSIPAWEEKVCDLQGWVPFLCEKINRDLNYSIYTPNKTRFTTILIITIIK